MFDAVQAEKDMRKANRKELVMLIIVGVLLLGIFG